MRTQMDNPHSEFPILSVLFSIATLYSWYLSTFDVEMLDKTIFLPAAHLVTVASGITAITLGFISIKDKLKKRRK